MTALPTTPVEQARLWSQQASRFARRSDPGWDKQVVDALLARNVPELERLVEVGVAGGRR